MVLVIHTMPLFVDTLDFSKLTLHQAKRAEMESQVCIILDSYIHYGHAIEEYIL